MKFNSTKRDICTILFGLMVAEWWLFERFIEADVYVSGYGWSNSLRHSWAVFTNHAQYWDYFREPFHGLLVGLMGFALQDFGQAGVFVSILSIQGVLLCVAHTIAMLCKSSTKKSISIAIGLVVTALSLPYTSLWSNGYPLSTLGFALLMNTSVRYIQKASLFNCFALSLGIAFALCTDTRLWGFLSIPVLSIGWVFLRQRCGHHPIWTGLLFLSLLFPSVVKMQLGSLKEHEITVFEKRLYQQDVALRWVRITRNERMKRMCEEMTSTDFWKISFWMKDCSRAVVSDNLYRRFQPRIPMTLSSFAIVIMIVLLVKRRNRSIWIVFVGYGLPLWALAASTPFAVRYTVFIVPFTSIWLSCLYSKIPMRFGWVFAGAMFHCSMMISLHQHKEYLNYVREQGIPTEVVEVVQREISIEKEGHLLRDCSENGITKALLPLTIEGDIPAHRQDVDDACDGFHWTNQILFFDLHTRAIPSTIFEEGTKIFHIRGFEAWRKQ